MNVPFLDLRAQYSTIEGEIHSAIGAVMHSCAFAGGPFVEQFENEWAAYCGVQNCVAVGSGTDALWLSLVALGVGRGDEVITVPNTFVATAEAIAYSGASPVFVDIDEKYFTMNPDMLEDAISANTKAIIPVHLFGQMCDMDPIMEIAARHGLPVIEDACQAHGATYKGRRAGSIGEAAAFSFYPGKNLGAYGEAGAITTSNQVLADKIRMLRDHGQSRKYRHDLIGWNARMDGIQAAVLTVKLAHLEQWTASRRQHADRYRECLCDVDGLINPLERPGCRHVYHLYVVRVKERDVVAARLREVGVGTGIHYPVPIHRQQCFRSHSVKAHPVTEQSAVEILSLPMFAELTGEAQTYVCEAVAVALQYR